VGTPSYVDPIMDPNLMSIRQQQNIEGLTTPQSNRLRDIASKVGGDLAQFGQEIASIPGAVFDSLSNTVEVFGQKFNIGKTAAGLVLNKLAGGPVSLLFSAADALSNILPEPSIQRKTAAIVGIQDPENPNKDIFGKNIDSAFGDYDLMNKQQISNLTDQLTKNAPKYGVTVNVNPVTGELEVIGPPTNVTSYNYANAYMLNELDKRTEYEDTRNMSNIGQQTITGPNINEEEGRPDDPGETTGINEADVEAGLATESISDFADDFDDGTMTGKAADSMDDVLGPMPEETNIVDEVALTGGEGPDTGSSEASVNEADVEAGLATESMSDFSRSEGGGGNGGNNNGKIVCTMMNESYGFGSFRNKIWMKFHKDLSPEYQKGYHKLFLPLVKIAKTNKVVKKILEHIAVHSTIDMRQATRGKTHLLGRIYRKILLPICYWVGKYAKR